MLIRVNALALLGRVNVVPASAVAALVGFRHVLAALIRVNVLIAFGRVKIFTSFFRVNLLWAPLSLLAGYSLNRGAHTATTPSLHSVG